MNKSTTISPIEAFRKAFLPFAWLPFDGGMAYPFKDERWAKNALDKANRVILQHGFHVTAAVEEYVLDGKTRIGLTIRPVPDEFDFKDEVQDDEVYEEEKAEWPQ